MIREGFPDSVDIQHNWIQNNQEHKELNDLGVITSTGLKWILLMMICFSLSHLFWIGSSKL